MSFVDVFIKQVKIILDPERLKAVVDSFIRKNYNNGLQEVEERLSVETNIIPNKEVMQFLSDYTFNNIKDMNDELVTKMRQELSRAIMNGEGTKEIKERIKKIMKVGDGRAKAIARTESHRAYNSGSYETARQSGLKLRKRVFNPSPETAICRHLVKQRPIGIDEKFEYDGDEWLLPPFHVNCGSRVLYEEVEE